jgi:flagellar motility protein MotE (MotC chaperone)
MSPFANRFVTLGVIALAALFAGDAVAQNDAKPKSAPVATDASGDGVSRFCGNVAPVAAEARIAWQTKRLSELDAQLRQRISDLDSKEAEARDWVTKRETMMNAAGDEVVAIYSKMDPEAASAQMAAMDESIAAGVLAKLKANVASAILNEMDPAKAGRLTGILSGAVSPTLSPDAPAAAPVPEKKS